MLAPLSRVRAACTMSLLALTMLAPGARAASSTAANQASPSPSTAANQASPSPSTAANQASPSPSPSRSGYALLLPSPSPQPVVVGPPAPKPPLLRWAYMVGTTLPDAVLQHPDDFDVLSPDWFHLDSQGNVYSDYGPISPEVFQFLEAHNIKLAPIVANGEFDPKVAHDMLIDGTLQTHVLDSLQALLNTPDYIGLNIDFENLYASDRTNFSAFMANVYARLHPLGKLVSLALPSKTQDNGDGFAAPFDYAGLAPNIDLAVIMTYDYHYAGGPAGAVAPLSWVNDVVNYATQFIPPNKLLLGLPFYGYNWNLTYGGWADAMSYDDIVSTVFTHGGKVAMDTSSQSPEYTYTDDNGAHQIWLEDSTSLGYKINLAESHHLAGWAAWRLGQEDPNFWSLDLKGK